MFGTPGVPFHLIAPEPPDDIARRIEPTGEVAGAEQGLHHIAQHVFAVRCAIVAGLFAQPDMC